MRRRPPSPTLFPYTTLFRSGEKIRFHQELVKRVVIAPHVQDYAIRCTLATHPQGMFAIPMVNQFLRVGASPRAAQAIDRKSTRLNSSHGYISYAVFCLKKKT